MNSFIVVTRFRMLCVLSVLSLFSPFFSVLFSLGQEFALLLRCRRSIVGLVICILGYVVLGLLIHRDHPSGSAFLDSCVVVFRSALVVVDCHSGMFAFERCGVVSIFGVVAMVINPGTQLVYLCTYLYFVW